MNSSTELKTNKSLQSLEYSGKVKISLMNNKQVLTTKEYHNSGTPLLFKYLAEALAGKLNSNLPPQKLALYTLSDVASTAGISPLNFSWESAEEFLTPMTSMITYTSAPEVRPYNNGGYQTILQFVVPYSRMINPAENPAYVLGLFPAMSKSASNDLGKALAFFCLADPETSVWEPIRFEDAFTTYNLLVEWALLVTNHTTENITETKEGA